MQPDPQPLQPLTQSDLRGVFGRREGLELPNLDIVDWGVLDYFGWVHSSGLNGYVVIPVGDQLGGLKLRRMQNHNPRPRTHMCSWCHHVYRSRGTAMFSVEVAGSDGRRSIGNYICRNLDCSLRIRNLASDPPTYLPETIDLQRKVTRLQISMLSFLSRANRLPDTA
ncbi:MAG: FBP domain-containing protein [Pseudomonadota bacterium]